MSSKWVIPHQAVYWLDSKKRTLDLGDILRWLNVQTNNLLASKWKMHYNIMFNMIFHITANSCQLIVKLDIDISFGFKVMLFWVHVSTNPIQRWCAYTNIPSTVYTCRQTLPVLCSPRSNWSTPALYWKCKRNEGKC